MQDATHHVAIYTGTQELIKHKIQNSTYIFNEQLHAVKHSIHHVINIQVEGGDGEHISHMCRCTGSQRWHVGNPWNQWVGVNQS
jgi:hypothetical protein